MVFKEVINAIGDTIDIGNVIEKDAGWYKCIVSNHGGSEESQVYIDVLCKLGLIFY